MNRAAFIAYAETTAASLRAAIDLCNTFSAPVDRKTPTGRAVVEAEDLLYSAERALTRARVSAAADQEEEDGRPLVEKVTAILDAAAEIATTDAELLEEIDRIHAVVEKHRAVATRAVRLQAA